MDDRLDALFADLEATARSEAAHARRGELAEEATGLAAEHTLLQRLRGLIGARVHIRVAGRDITGTATFLGDNIIVIMGVEASIVAIDGISQLRTDSRLHLGEVGALEKLGFGSALRRLAADHEEVALDLRHGAGMIRGYCGLVAKDYVDVAGRVIPFSAIAVLTARVDPFAN